MRVLGIETSGMAGGIALMDDDRIVHERFFERGMIHGRELAPALKELEEKHAVPLASVDLIAVDYGPGSYTGLRVGLQTAKAMAFALRKPIIGIASLDVLAQNIGADRKCATFCPMMDAKWDQVYSAVYRFENGRPTRITNHLAETPEHVLAWIPDGTLLYGTGATRFRSVFEQRKIAWGTEEDGIPKPHHVCRLGREAYTKGERHDIFKIVPMYLRSTEAEVKKTAVGKVISEQ